MLDIYFAIRFLQLREQMADEDGTRSSKDTLKRLLDLGIVGQGEYAALNDGYDLLSDIDHALRLIVGRSNVIPHSAHPMFAKLVHLVSHREQFLRDLNLHRLRVRDAYDSVLGIN
jgi:glutamine synthetase adenylyltransferase